MLVLKCADSLAQVLHVVCMCISARCRQDPVDTPQHHDLHAIQSAKGCLVLMSYSVSKQGDQFLKTNDQYTVFIYRPSVNPVRRLTSI